MEERQQIIKNNVARIAEYQAMGMTTEQAKGATKALAAMAGQKPIDRIKQAAKLRAMGAAMGIEGANEAADILIKGQRATDEDKKKLATFQTKMSNRMSESATGDFGMEIFASKIQEKLGTKDTDASSVFNTKLTEGNKLQEDALKHQAAVPPILKEIVRGVSQLGAAKANPAVQAAGGVGLSLWDTFGSGAMGAAGGLLMGKKLLSPTTVPDVDLPEDAPDARRTKRNRGGGRADRAAKAAKYLKYGRMAGTVAKPLALGIAGYEAYDAFQEHAAGNVSESERNAKIGAAGGGLAGMWAGAAAGGAIGGIGGFGVGAIPGALIGGALGYWGGSSAGEALGGMTGDKELPADKHIAGPRQITSIPPAIPDTEKFNTTVQNKLGAREDTQPVIPVPPLTSADTRADATSPIGLQLSLMERSADHLKTISELTSKQLTLAEQQLAATIVSGEDRSKLFKELSHGNRFMTSYTTPQ
jgi:hypothetical protein